ncbi:ribosomal protein l11 methyltransferase [hydrocarbon metagenome]|uniref:Ribosomal protein l11 methyltransferase n=1 Tax=hydrocarbon metagenome TaxID=938273 RepID=A0A0W8G0R6_9ZZZZ
MKKHKVFIVSSIPFNVDILSGLLWNLEIEGLTESENFLTVYANQESNVNEKILTTELKKFVRENLIESFEISADLIEEINWNEEWEKKFSPIEVTEKIVIKPSFKEVENANDKLVITIDPKMSFGTGEHETTKLVLQLLEETFNNHRKVLDVGSGTAVLAIAAAKMGAENVIAVDNDEWCLENGLENIRTNNVEKIVKVKLGEINSIEETGFDLILANINKNILIEIADDIYRKISASGDLILSGLLIQDEEDIKSAYTKKGFRFIQTKKLNEWIALKFENSLK